MNDGDSDIKLGYHGTGGAFFGLTLGNAILTLLTLGIYTFWARTKVREFHYSHTDVGGDRFAYHGTGQELLRGYLKATGIVMLLAIALGVASALTGGESAPVATQIAIPLVFYAAIFVLIIFAINGARRYRMSRSSWRGIRFSYHSDAEDFAKMMLIGSAFQAITLGFFSPYFQNQRRAYLVNHTRFGSEEFRYAAPPDPLVKEWLKALLLTIPTLGLSWVWFSAYRHRYFWSNTHIGDGRFDSQVTGEEIMGLFFINFILAIITLGIATPWIVTRSHAFWTSRLSLVGSVDWAAIQQRAQAASEAAEGLADSMDVDVGLEM
jgi:uncharacterized membrane protein YjgN (DUF898 family)